LKSPLATEMYGSSKLYLTGNVELIVGESVRYHCLRYAFPLRWRRFASGEIESLSGERMFFYGGW
jgi:hypothetical protein